MLGRRGIGREPALVAIGVKIALVVQRDRLEEDDDPAVLRGHGDRAAEHARRVVARPARRSVRDVAQGADAVVVVEVAAEALLVREAGDANDHGVAELAAAEELEAGRLAANLVERVVHVGEVLDLRDGKEPDVRRSLGDAEDARLVQQRVEDAGGTEPLLEPVRDAVHAALAPDVLAEQRSSGRRSSSSARAALRQPASVRAFGVTAASGSVEPNEGARSSAAGERDAGRDPSRWYGAIGATTSSVVWRRGRRAASSATASTRSRASRTSAPSSSGVAAPSSTSRRAFRAIGSRASTASISGRSVALLGIAAGMAPQPHRSKVQECRLPCAGHGRWPPTASHTSSSSPSAAVPQMRLLPYVEAIQPSGVGTLIPVSLSSHTSRSGIGRPMRTAYRAVLIAERAVAWFALASPNEQTTMASSGSSWATPMRLARPRLKARPIALGRWLAIVLVCGGIHSARLPQTLWRPWEMGSSLEATTPSRASMTGVLPASCRERAMKNPPER